MAFTHVKTMISPSVVKVGGTSTPAGGTDDLLTTGSAVKFQPRVDFIRFDTHSDSFTKRKGVPAARVWDVSCTTYLQGSGALGTVAINGFASLNALFTAAMMTPTVTAGTSIAYAPATVAASGTAKCVVWGENHGLLHKANNVVGNIVFTGQPTGGMEVAFTGVGDYAEPTVASISGFTGGATRFEPFLNVKGTITNSSGAYTPVITQVRFDRGVQTARILDANATTGIQENFVRDIRPSLTMSIAMDTGAANVTYPNIYANLFASSTHAVVFTVGTATGNKVAFSFPTAELTNVRLREGDGYLIGDLEYDVTHATDETEFSITIT